MVNKPELLFSGAAFLVCANNDFSSFQTYFSDSSRLWSWFHETVNWVLEGLQDEKHHHHMLQCIEALQTGFAYSNVFTRFWRNNCPGRPCADLGALCPCCSAFTRNQHGLTFFFGENGSSCHVCALAGGSSPDRLSRLGGVLSDLGPSSPDLHTGDAVLSHCIFQK